MVNTHDTSDTMRYLLYLQCNVYCMDYLPWYDTLALEEVKGKNRESKSSKLQLPLIENKKLIISKLLI